MKSLEISVPFPGTNTHTQAHMCTKEHSQVKRIKPDMFVCFILAAFQVFKILDHI